MYGTYTRLGVHVFATPREVIQAARKKLKKRFRSAHAYRAERHRFYRAMLEYHFSEQRMVRQFRL